MSDSYNPEFIEDYHSRHLCPLAEKHLEFDHEAVDHRLGFVSTASDEARAQVCDFAMAFVEHLLGDLELFNIDPKRTFKRKAKGTKGTPNDTPTSEPSTPPENPRAKIIGARAIAVAWVLKPELFGGASLTAVAKSLGFHVMYLSPHAAEFTRKFGIRNRAQSHAWQLNQPAKESPTNTLPDDSLEPGDHEGDAEESADD